MLQTYRRLIMPVYFPDFVTSVVSSAVLILLPLYLLDRGQSVAMASFIIAARGIGLLLADIPAGLFANRFGDKSTMVVGCSALMLAMVLLFLSDNGYVVVAAAMLSGVSVSFALIGRMSYISDSVANRERGRAVALMAGLQRAGAMIGPLVFGSVAKFASYETAFGLMFLFTLVSLGLIMTFAVNHDISQRLESSVTSVLKVFVKYRTALLSMGLAGLALMVVRNTRILMFPIYGHLIGLDEVQIGLLFSLSSLIDMLMFYPAGQIMDSHGRRWTAIPGTLVLSLSMLVLPLLPSLAGIVIFATLSGLGNGITTGILLTLGADLAPERERGQFLAAWRLNLDAGQTAAPLVVGTLSELATVATAMVSVCTIGLAGVLIFSLFMQETLNKNA